MPEIFTKIVFAKCPNNLNESDGSGSLYAALEAISRKIFIAVYHVADKKDTAFPPAFNSSLLFLSYEQFFSL